MTGSEQICRKCKGLLDISQFRKNPYRKSGVDAWCKDCKDELSKRWKAFTKRTPRKHDPNKARERAARDRKANPEKYATFSRTSLLKRYGLTLEAYDAMAVLQGNACAICGTVTPGGKTLCVDHCHKTGVVRGLLCTTCNTALGSARDSPEILRRAANYLEQRRSEKLL